MRPLTRKEFLQTMALASCAAFTTASFSVKKYQPRLCFSTLGCPDWSFQQVLAFAAKHGYTGIELRGIKRELDLTKTDVFSSKEKRKISLALIKDNGLQFAALGSSANLHIANNTERQKNLDEARRFIDLAEELQCPYVRVFPNIFPEGQEKAATIELIIQGLKELGEFTRGSNVKVLMETHGDLVWCSDLLSIMRAVASDQTGLVWDISNMWTVTKESPVMVYQELKNYILHTHIKDAKMVGNMLQYQFLGKGEVPIFDAVDLLAKDNYKGFFSFEWEKLWHPEIAEPELALADYPRAMKRHFK